MPSAVIAPTQADVRYVCFEGQAGLINTIPKELIADYNKSDLIIRLANGATIRGFSAEKANRLRGPEHARIWADELAAWGPDGEEVYDMAMFGLRAGPNPKFLWTSTPKPNALVQMLTKPQEGRIIIRGSTNDNRANLPKKFLDNLEKYKGTQIYRQEVLGELLDPAEAGLIKRSWMRLWPANKPLPRLDYIVMSLDTAFTEATSDIKKGADPTACAVFGVFVHEGRSNVLLLDCWQEHLGLPELVKRVKRELNVAYGDDQDASMLKPMFGSSKMLTAGRKPDLCLIEDKGSGISLRQYLDREGIQAYAYNPGRADKLARLHMVSHTFARRQVWLPESAKLPGKPRTWVEPLLEQLCSFAGEGSIRHDDFVDATTQCLRVLLDKNLLNPVKLERQAKEAERDRKPEEPYLNPYSV
jgi:predicted phage terminase large subunit-like protein